MTDAQYEKALEELEDDMENGYITKEEYRRYLRELILINFIHRLDSSYSSYARLRGS